MDRLSSCYFCGTALDASLSEYPVVPKDLHPDPDQQRSVVLCPTCRRKLATVVETVVGAIDADVDADLDREAPSAEDTAQGPDVGQSIGSDSGDPAGSTADAADRGRTDDQSAVSAGDADRDTDGPGTERPADDPGTEHETADSETGRGTDGTGTEREDEDASADGDRTTGDGADGGTMTALEYNKVMRLLQNREFPVDRAEIREVAVNAYDLSPDEFEAVIEAAIERGLIAEDDAQFVAAE